MLISFREFASQNAGRPREEFLAEVKEPYLLIPSLSPASVADDPGSFSTMRFAPPSAFMGSPGEGSMIIPVRKRRDSNAFAMMITLGRAPNNDLVIPDQRVSKFHAYFRRLGDRWMINDANSMNGTWVDGQAVPSDRSAALKSGSSIRLAETLELVFLEPPELFERLQKNA